MKLITKYLLVLFSLYCFINILVGCGDGNSPDPTILQKIEIESSNGNKLDIKEVSTLTASGFDQLNAPYDISATLEWSSNNDNVSVDANGIVTPLVIGTSVITVSAEGVKATYNIRVWDSSAPRTEIYVSDVADYFNLGQPKILKYDIDGKNPEVFIDNNLGAPQDILFLEDQEVVLISNATSGRITKYNANTGAYIGNFASNIKFPTRMKIGPDGLLYVLQWQGEKVLRFELDGTTLGAFTSLGVKESIGLDWDSDGNLYVSSYNEGAPGFVRKFDSSGNDMGLFISSGLQGPTNIWFDDSGNLMVNDWLGNAVRKFNSSGSFINNFVTGVSQVEGVDFLDNGDIIIGVGATATVKQYTSSGAFVKDLVTAGLGGLVKPNAVRIRKVNY